MKTKECIYVTYEFDPTMNVTVKYEKGDVSEVQIRHFTPSWFEDLADEKFEVKLTPARCQKLREVMDEWGLLTEVFD